MLGLTLREEFRGKRLKGTAIELSNESNTGATQIAAREFLEITYPTHDLLKGIEAVGPSQGRPVVVMGERGLGKSHLMAALFHAVHDPSSTEAWLKSWAVTLGQPEIGQIPLRSGMLVIGESLHRQRYKFLWDLLFEQHPHGAFIKGKWEGMGASKTDIPSDQLILELLRHTPSMLLLDEFQTWYDGLTNTKQFPWKNWAFNFIQILSEIAKEHPDLLALVVSVRNGDTDAYQQIHRVNPVQVDFKAGGSPERIQHDRRRMLLHRLFENRLQIGRADVEAILRVHISEYFRLLDVPSSEQDRKRADFIGYSTDTKMTGKQFASRVGSGTVLFPMAKESMRSIQNGFVKAEQTIDLVVYETLKTDATIETSKYDIVLFTSPSNVDAFFEKNKLSSQKVIAMGDATASALKKYRVFHPLLPDGFDDVALTRAVFGATSV